MRIQKYLGRLWVVGNRKLCTVAETQKPEHSVPHIPVLSSEVVNLFQPAPSKTYIDMTFGAGGHSRALLNACPEISIIALDRDKSALAYGEQLQLDYGRDRVRLLHGSFTDIVEILRGQGHSTANIADGILFDVGASSMQYSNRDRGFSVTNNGPLDMRMNRDEETPTAADVVNKLEEKDLYKILKKYGEEKLSRQIARLVVEYRQMMGPITTTKDLREVVSEVYRAAEATRKVDKAGRKQHVATLTFQALRIFVNDELNQLYNGLKIAHLLLKPNGICAVISFHSLEHNVTHQVFNTKHAIDKQTLVTPNLHQTAFLYPWKCDSSVIKPSEEEVTQNPRSRSAELRVAFKKSVQR